MSAGAIAASYVAAGGGGGGYAAEVLADSPLVYWRMGDASGTTATDSSGNSRNGTYMGSPTLGSPSLVPSDTSNTAVDLSGTSQYVRISSASWMNVANITLEAVIQPDAVSGIKFVMDRDLETGGNSAFQFRLNGNKLEFIVFDGGPAKTATGATSLVAGTKYLVHGTYDGSNAKVYVNGVQDGTVAGAGSLLSAGAALCVGAHANGAGNFLDGKVDEAAMYGTALSSTRIAAHFAATGL